MRGKNGGWVRFLPPPPPPGPPSKVINTNSTLNNYKPQQRTKQTKFPTLYSSTLHAAAKHGHLKRHRTVQ